MLSKEKQAGRYSKRRGKASERTKLRKKCLRLWGGMVRDRDNHTCQKCGRPANQPHHIFSRGTTPKPADFLMVNGVTLCVNCHKWRGAHSTSFEEQKEFNEWVRKWLVSQGKDYDTLKIMCTAKGRFTLQDLQLMHMELLRTAGKGGAGVAKNM